MAKVPSPKPDSALTSETQTEPGTPPEVSTSAQPTGEPASRRPNLLNDVDAAFDDLLAPTEEVPAELTEGQKIAQQRAHEREQARYKPGVPVDIKGAPKGILLPYIRKDKINRKELAAQVEAFVRSKALYNLGSVDDVIAVIVTHLLGDE